MNRRSIDRWIETYLYMCIDIDTSIGFLDSCVTCTCMPHLTYRGSVCAHKQGMLLKTRAFAYAVQLQHGDSQIAVSQHSPAWDNEQ